MVYSQRNYSLELPHLVHLVILEHLIFPVWSFKRNSTDKQSYDRPTSSNGLDIRGPPKPSRLVSWHADQKDGDQGFDVVHFTKLNPK